ncbi:hypothetical protein EQH57_0136 [Dictyocoela roeselum]|nr:hypothetical protein EQH57_0136 [Dictyocoela roeselum]
MLFFTRSKEANIDTEPSPAVEQRDEPVENEGTGYSDSAEPVASTSEENLSDKENQSPPPSRDGNCAKSIIAEESTSTSDPSSKKKPTEHVKLFKRNLEPSAIREVLAEIPIGLDAEESEDDGDSDHLSLNALKKRVRGIADKVSSQVDASTSGIQASEVDQPEKGTEAVKTVQSVDSKCTSSESCENGSSKGDKLGFTDLDGNEDANKALEPADDELNGKQYSFN